MTDQITQPLYGRQVDKESGTVVVESGVVVSDLNEILADNGLGLSRSVTHFVYRTLCDVSVLLYAFLGDHQ